MFFDVLNEDVISASELTQHVTSLKTMLEVLQRESAKKDEAVVRLQSEKKNLLRASAAVGTLILERHMMK